MIWLLYIPMGHAGCCFARIQKCPLLAHQFELFYLLIGGIVCFLRLSLYRVKSTLPRRLCSLPSESRFLDLHSAKVPEHLVYYAEPFHHLEDLSFGLDSSVLLIPSITAGATRNTYMYQSSTTNMPTTQGLVAIISPGTIIAAGVVFPALGVVFVALRFYTRCIQKARLMMDDYLTLPALVSMRHARAGSIYIY